MIDSPEKQCLLHRMYTELKKEKKKWEKKFCEGLQLERDFHFGNFSRHPGLNMFAYKFW